MTISTENQERTTFCSWKSKRR